MCCSCLLCVTHVCYMLLINCSLFMLFVLLLFVVHCLLIIICTCCSLLIMCGSRLYIATAHHVSVMLAVRCSLLIMCCSCLLYVVWLTAQLMLFKFSVSLTNLASTGVHAITALKVIIQTRTKKDKNVDRISSRMAVIMMKIWLIYDENMTKIWWQYDEIMTY